jgi:uncharacterized protein (DUF433 family)
MPRIVRNPDIMGGKPCVAGTRVPVEHILDWLARGESIEDVLIGYPDISREDVYAAIGYARDYIHTEGVLAA